MKVFIANPVEVIPGRRTKIVSILFSKSKWDKKRDEIKKWIKSRFKVQKVNILEGGSKHAKYLHVRVARENKSNPKRVIWLSKPKGIKAIVELVPVVVGKVYNYAETEESVDGIDKASGVGYNVKVNDEIKEFIMKNSELTGGNLAKMIKKRFGIDISPNTVNRYKRGIKKQVEASVEKKTKKKKTTKKVKTNREKVGKSIETKINAKKVKHSKTLRIGSYVGENVEATIPYDRQALTSIAKIGDGLFLVVTGTGKIIGKVLFDGGECFIKTAKKTIKIDGSIKDKIKNLLK